MPRARRLVLAAVAGVFAATLPLSAQTVQEAYARKLAEISPRDPDGHYELAIWCREKGLSEAAQKLLERIVAAIDPDHPKAREALGYKRFGLEWRPAKEIPDEAKPEPEASDSEAAKPAPVPAKSSTPESTSPAPAAGPGAPGPAKSGPPAPKAPGSGEVGLEKIEDLVQRKKRFAEEAATAVPLVLTHIDDGDFLIHTTHPSGARQLKSLQDELKKVKLSVISILGVRPQTPIWPQRLQFFYLRAVECAEFSEKVLSKRFDDSNGWMEIDAHTLLLNRIDSDELALFAGRRALERFNGSRQWVSWWLHQGLAGLVAARSEEGQRRDFLAKAYRDMAATIQVDPKSYVLQDIFERPDRQVVDGDKAQHMAMTFVDFLAAQRGKGLGKLITELKSGDALPPQDPKSPEFRSFTIDYLSLQDKLLRNHFRMSPEQLEDRWKEHVIERQRTMDRQNPPKDRQNPPKDRGRGTDDSGRRRGDPRTGGGKESSGGDRKNGETKPTQRSSGDS